MFAGAGLMFAGVGHADLTHPNASAARVCARALRRAPGRLRLTVPHQFGLSTRPATQQRVVVRWT
jgi:hypothetical protein